MIVQLVTHLYARIASAAAAAAVFVLVTDYHILDSLLQFASNIRY